MRPGTSAVQIKQTVFPARPTDPVRLRPKRIQTPRCLSLMTTLRESRLYDTEAVPSIVRLCFSPAMEVIDKLLTAERHCASKLFHSFDNAPGGSGSGLRAPGNDDSCASPFFKRRTRIDWPEESAVSSGTAVWRAQRVIVIRFFPQSIRCSSCVAILFRIVTPRPSSSCSKGL